MNVCAFTSVCDEDSMWFHQYIQEAERLDLPFAIHLDRCDNTLHKILSTHRLCVGSTRSKHNREFRESDKQDVMNLVKAKGFKWAMSWDVDETYDKDAHINIVKSLVDKTGLAKVWWVNLWGDKHHVRVDGPFVKKPRDRFYDLHNYKWKFRNSITNGPYSTPNLIDQNIHQTDVVCIHWGMMTLELREMHKQRWDRIYTASTGSNPYKFWSHALNEVDFPPVIEPKTYL